MIVINLCVSWLISSLIIHPFTYLFSHRNKEEKGETCVVLLVRRATFMPILGSIVVTKLVLQMLIWNPCVHIDIWQCVYNQDLCVRIRDLCLTYLIPRSIKLNRKWSYLPVCQHPNTFIGVSRNLLAKTETLRGLQKSMQERVHLK